MKPTWREIIQNICAQAKERGHAFMLEGVEVCVIKHAPDWNEPAGYFTVHRVSDGAHCGDGDSNQSKAIEDARMPLACGDNLPLPIL